MMVVRVAATVAWTMATAVWVVATAAWVAATVAWAAVTAVLVHGHLGHDHSRHLDNVAHVSLSLWFLFVSYQNDLLHLSFFISTEQ